MTTSSDKAARPLLLLVEDNAKNVRLFEEILGANGYRVSVATEGEQAVELARTLQPQLILMDLQLPGMDGCTAAEKLKADPRTSEIPIIALTAHPMPEHRRQMLDAGCAGYIAKPISYKPFLAEIASALSGQLQTV